MRPMAKGRGKGAFGGKASRRPFKHRGYLAPLPLGPSWASDFRGENGSIDRQQATIEAPAQPLIVRENHGDTKGSCSPAVVECVATTDGDRRASVGGGAREGVGRWTPAGRRIWRAQAPLPGPLGPALPEGYAPPLCLRIFGSSKSEVAVAMNGSNKVSATRMASHLGLSRAYLDQLVADGILARDGSGKFDLDESRLRYIRRLREARRTSPLTEAQARHQRAKARQLELENASKEEQLMEVEDHIAAVDEIVGIMLTHLSALPARCTRDLPTRRVIERAIVEMRQAIANTAAKRTRDHLREARGNMDKDTPNEVS